MKFSYFILLFYNINNNYSFTNLQSKWNEIKEMCTNVNISDRQIDRVTNRIQLIF